MDYLIAAVTYAVIALVIIVGEEIWWRGLSLQERPRRMWPRRIAYFVSSLLLVNAAFSLLTGTALH